MANVNLRTEMTAHIRGRIKSLGIRARVSGNPGSQFGINVSVPAYTVKFTAEEQRAIKQLAISNGLTSVCGLPIDIDFVSDAPGLTLSFYLTSDGIEAAQHLHDKYPSLYTKAA